MWLIMYKLGCAWAGVRLLGTQSASTQTKSGWSILRLMAQFTRIMCLEMWASCPGLRVAQVGAILTFFIITTDVIRFYCALQHIKA
jgi:hypothetical protein